MYGEGYMRYNVTTGINLDTCSSVNITAFGVIWKIEFQNGSEFYIPQVSKSTFGTTYLHPSQ